MRMGQRESQLERAAATTDSPRFLGRPAYRQATPPSHSIRALQRPETTVRRMCEFPTGSAYPLGALRSTGMFRRGWWIGLFLSAFGGSPSSADGLSPHHVWDQHSRLSANDTSVISRTLRDHYTATGEAFAVVLLPSPPAPSPESLSAWASRLSLTHRIPAKYGVCWIGERKCHCRVSPALEDQLPSQSLHDLVSTACSRFQKSTGDAPLVTFANEWILLAQEREPGPLRAGPETDAAPLPLPVAVALSVLTGVLFTGVAWAVPRRPLWHTPISILGIGSLLGVRQRSRPRPSWIHGQTKVLRLLVHAPILGVTVPWISRLCSAFLRAELSLDLQKPRVIVALHLRRPDRSWVFTVSYGGSDPSARPELSVHSALSAHLQDLLSSTHPERALRKLLLQIEPALTLPKQEDS